MLSKKKVVHLKFYNFFTVFLPPLLLITTCWLLLIGLSQVGFPFPEIKIEKFSDLGFFSISILGSIVFLTLIPFQRVEEKLSPIFYSKIYNSPSAHFGTYVLMFTSIISFSIIIFQHALDLNMYLSQLFIALTLSIIFAVLFHRAWLLRCLYQPYTVYKYIKTLQSEESLREVWLELFECTFKAIKQGRVGDTKNSIELMDYIYKKFPDLEKIHLHEDIINLCKIAEESRPIARFLEEKWPFCRKNTQQKTLHASYPIVNEAAQSVFRKLPAH